MLSRIIAPRLAARLLLILLSMGAGVIAVDVGLRISDVVAPRRGVLTPTPARHALTDWIDVFPPGYSGTLTSKDFKSSVRADSLGFRERELDLGALATQHPYLFLGDSYFFGWGVEQQQRISEVFAATSTDAAGRPAPVVNFSFPGWGTYHYLAVWDRFVPQLQPRLVVISTFVGNDFTDDLKQSWRSLDENGTRADAENGSPGVFLRSTLALRELFATSPVIALADHALWASPRFRSLFNGFEIHNDRIALYERNGSDLQKQLYGATEAALESIARRSRAAGVPVLVVLIPDHLQVLMPKLFDGYDFDKPQRTIGEFLEQQGVACLDLLPAFQGVDKPEELFFREDKHWNQRGHAFVADALRRRLRTDRSVAADNNYGAPARR